MRVLVLSQYFWPESFRINEVVESLQGAGCDVCVLTGQPNYPDGRVFQGYRAMEAGRARHAAGYDIFRVPLVPRGAGGAARLVLNYLSFVFFALVVGPWLLRGRRFDVVFVYAPSPILQVIPAIWLAWIKRAKLVTWVQDMWPESLSATGFVRNTVLLSAVARVVRWIYRRNDLLLVQSKAFISSVEGMAGGTKVLYHPNPGELPVGGGTVETPALKLQPGFNVLFAGNLGSVQALDTVLDAAERLQAYDDVRLVLVGSGSRSEWIHQEVVRRGLSNVQMAGRFEAQAMPAIFAQASALLVSLTRHPVLALTVPSKVQAYLAAGRPVIASLDGEGARVVAESGAGLACPAEDASALAQAVLQLRNASAEMRERMGLAGRQYYADNFDPTVLTARLVEILASVTSDTGRQEQLN